MISDRIIHEWLENSLEFWRELPEVATHIDNWPVDEQLDFDLDIVPMEFVRFGQIEKERNENGLKAEDEMIFQKVLSLKSEKEDLLNSIVGGSK